MYKFSGYFIVNEFGDVVGYAKNKAEALKETSTNGIPQERIIQAYVFKVEPESKTNEENPVS